jgi:hypothetical protein
LNGDLDLVENLAVLLDPLATKTLETWLAELLGSFLALKNLSLVVSTTMEADDDKSPLQLIEPIDSHKAWPNFAICWLTPHEVLDLSYASINTFIRTAELELDLLEVEIIALTGPMAPRPAILEIEWKVAVETHIPTQAIITSIWLSMLIKLGLTIRSAITSSTGMSPFMQAGVITNQSTVRGAFRGESMGRD